MALSMEMAQSMDPFPNSKETDIANHEVLFAGFQPSRWPSAASAEASSSSAPLWAPDRHMANLRPKNCDCCSFGGPLAA